MADPWTELTNAARNPGRALSDIGNGFNRAMGEVGGWMDSNGLGSFSPNRIQDFFSPKGEGPISGLDRQIKAKKEEEARLKELDALAAMAAGMQRTANGRASTILSGNNLSTAGTSAARVLLGA